MCVACESTAAGVDPFLAAVASVGGVAPCNIGATDAAGIGRTGVRALAAEKEQKDQSRLVGAAR